MKKILGTLAALMLILSMVACGKSETNQENVASEVMGFDSIAFNGTTLTFPCKVQDVENALKGLNVREEDIAEIVEPNDTYFGSIFDYNNTTFAAKNLSDSPLTVRECDVIMVSTTISLLEQIYDVVYPAGIEYGKEFDKEKVFEILGEPTSVEEDAETRKFQFKATIENVCSYDMSVLVDAEDMVVGVSLIGHPEIKKIAEAEAEAALKSEEAIEAEVTEEQTYYVKLLSHNEYKVAAIKVYREYTGFGLAEAKDVIDSAPCVVLETTDLELAQAMAAAFEAEGCIVDEDMLSSEIAE